MQKKIIPILLVAILVASPCAAAMKWSDLWNSLSSESKVMFVGGYISAAQDVCLHGINDNEKRLSQFCGAIKLRSDYKYEDVVLVIDEIYKDKKFSNVNISSFLFSTISYVSGVTSKKAFSIILENLPENEPDQPMLDDAIVRHKKMVENLLN